MPEVRAVRQARLILIEGAPGSGKSTLAQSLHRTLSTERVPARWWYEEEVGHPVYLFDDLAGLRQTIERLHSGDYERLIADALAGWDRFVHGVTGDDGVLLIDGCLFGYLTWSLFPQNVPERLITSYGAAVEELIAPLQPALIYLYQQDIDASLRRICVRRGVATEQRLLEQSTRSPYGRAHGLAGFDGMVQYWAAFRRLADEMFASVRYSKLAIDTSAGDWEAYEREAHTFLGLPMARASGRPDLPVGRFVGMYEYVRDGESRLVHVGSVKNGLTVNGMPEIWQETPLIPLDGDRFALQSYPFEVRFETDGDGYVRRMIVTGPELLGGSIPRVLARRESRFT